jgi:hypothetical protein
MNYIEALSAAREKFHVIGVVGMMHSGVNTFFTQLWQRNLIVIRGDDNMGVRNTMERMIEFGDQWVTLHMQHKGILWGVDENQQVTVDPESFVNVMTKNPAFYESFLEQSFETRMQNQIYRMRTLCDFYPGLSRSLGIPMFVELPLSAAIPDYNNLVDEMIVIKRKREVDPSHWAYKHFCETSPLTEAQTTQDRIDFMVRMDKYFDRCKIRPDVYLINHNSLDEYVQKVHDYLDTKVAGATDKLTVETILG